MEEGMGAKGPRGGSFDALRRKIAEEAVARGGEQGAFKEICEREGIGRESLKRWVVRYCPPPPPKAPEPEPKQCAAISGGDFLKEMDARIARLEALEERLDRVLMSMETAAAYIQRHMMPGSRRLAIAGKNTED